SSSRRTTPANRRRPMPFEYGDWITFDEVVGHLASLMESAGVTLPMIDREWEADGRPIKEQVAEWIGEDSHHQDQTHLKEKILNFVIENRCFTKLPRH